MQTTLLSGLAGSAHALNVYIQIEIVTGEDEEETVFETRAKCFHWGMGNAGLQWKERGVGELRLLRHKQAKTIRLLLRRDKTLKMAANHILSEEMKLETLPGDEKSWVYKVGWSAC